MLTSLVFLITSFDHFYLYRVEKKSKTLKII